MPTLNELVIQMTDDLQRDTANADVWVNGDEVATYADTNARIIPSIQKLVADFENRTEYTGVYAVGGTAYIRGQTFNEGFAAYVVTSDFTSTTFLSDAGSYKISFDLTTIVQTAIDAAAAAAASAAAAAISEGNASSSATEAAVSAAAALASEVAAEAAAASAVQQGDDVSRLFNDAGYINGTSLDGDAVDRGEIGEPFISPLIARVSDLGGSAGVGGVHFNSAGSAELGLGQCDFGLSDFSIILPVKLDDYMPAAQSEIFASHSAGDSRVVVTIETDGDWRLSFTDSVSTVTSYDITPTAAFVDGSEYIISITVDRDGNATLYTGATANGVVDVSAESDVDVGATNTNQGALFSASDIAGVLRHLVFCNFVLTASNLADIAASSALSWLGANPELKWGGDNSPTSGVHQKLGGTGTMSSATISGFVVDAGAASLTTSHSGNMVVGEKQTLRVSITVTGDLDNGTVLLSGGGPISNISSLALGTYDYFLTLPTASAFSDVRFASLSSVSGMTIEVNSVEVVGATSALPFNEGIAYQMHDTGDGAFDALLSTSGVSHIIKATEGFIRDFTVDAYNGGTGNQELVSSSRSILPAGAIIDSAVFKNNTGTITAATLILQRSSRSAYTTLGDNGAGLSGGQLMKVTITEATQTASYLNVALHSTDVDAISINVRINYKLIS
mgnify:CR=1 FL=1